MANLAASAVNLLDATELGDKNGKRIGMRRRFRLTLTGQGGLTNQILAATLGFTFIDRVYAGVVDGEGEEMVLAGPAPDGSAIRLYNLNQGTTTLRRDPYDSADTIIITVEGR